jgi:hypothetical protein
VQARLLRSALRALRIWLDLCAWNHLALLRARAAHWVSDELVLAVVLVLIVLFCAGGLGGSNAMAKIETSLRVLARGIYSARTLSWTAHILVSTSVSTLHLHQVSWHQI